MNELFVWECDDLRREIFSYLRKEPQLSCIDCKKVLIWDKKVEPHMKIPYLYGKDNGYYCIKCWGKYIPMSRHPCIIS